MFVVLFEVRPKPDRWDDYLGTAKLLRPELEQIDGFIDNERFRSERDEQRILSLSTWRDEKSVIRWRTHAKHHETGQKRGRFEIFADYRLRVGEVISDNQPPAGIELRQDRFDETEVGLAKLVTVTQFAVGDAIDITKSAAGLLEREKFRNLNQADAALELASWRDADALDAAPPPDPSPERRVRRIRIIREYGLGDRREAPQYFPDVR